MTSDTRRVGAGYFRANRAAYGANADRALSQVKAGRIRSASTAKHSFTADPRRNSR